MTVSRQSGQTSASEIFERRGSFGQELLLDLLSGHSAKGVFSHVFHRFRITDSFPGFQPFTRLRLAFHGAFVFVVVGRVFELFVARDAFELGFRMSEGVGA